MGLVKAVTCPQQLMLKLAIGREVSGMFRVTSIAGKVWFNAIYGYVGFIPNLAVLV